MNQKGINMGIRPIYYDTETTGVRVDKDRITEIAAYDPVEQRTFSHLVNPGIPIPKEASDITGITDEMVKDAPPFEEIAPLFAEFCGEDTILVAHNNDSFDYPLLTHEYKRVSIELPKWRYVDTLKWSRKYRPDLPRHSLQHLREIHGIPANNAHRALDDVIILHQVFSLMTDDLDIETIYHLLKEDSTTMQMPFGKYKGRPLRDVPKSYVSWLLDNGALDKPENESLRSGFSELGFLA